MGGAAWFLIFFVFFLFFSRFFRFFGYFSFFSGSFNGRGLKGGCPKGGGPKRVGGPKVGVGPKGGEGKGGREGEGEGSNILRFFPLPPQMSFFLLSGGLLVEMWPRFEIVALPKCGDTGRTI